jgi:hypothetical protein
MSIRKLRRSVRLSLSIFFLGLALSMTLGGACDDPVECRSDSECGVDRVCGGGRCVQCVSNANCEAGAFCCQGVCRPSSEIDRRCGCGTAATASPGQDCTAVQSDALCLVNDSVATPADVAQGTCGCGCTPDEGGPLCGPPAEPGGAPVCSCLQNADCRKASVDAEGRPHRVANTCAPQNVCVCFTDGPSAPCDPNGGAPDCSTGGCASLADDVQNCGVPGRSCLDPATGVADSGACVAGGCLCDDASDCAGGNVNTCAFVVGGEPARCVCAGYTAGGLQAACPMELSCSPNGCILDGIAFSSEESLRSALGLR